MRCFECHRSGADQVAEAVCCQCGVAVCQQHAHIEKQELHKDAGLGKSTHALSARRVVCPVCARAERSP
ncbi:DUF2180 family protein [Streptomyces flavidovirens]|uniref:DUF2180 family protein n=1 Tax=Streptomyces flavidovirens TaxID=67298 RepID=UPI0009973862|nr:DUF2180 family protein [Streptomyces flavidovirens]